MSYSFLDFRKTSKKSLGFQIRPKPSDGPPSSLVHSDSLKLSKSIINILRIGVFEL